jgi:amidase
LNKSSRQQTYATPSRDSHGRYLIPQEPHFFFFDASQSPAWLVPDGAHVRVEAIDGWVGRITSEQVLIDELPENQTNACTGPIGIEGAKPGDTLVVDIDDVQLMADTGVTAMMMGWGILGDRLPAPKTRVFPIQGGKVIFSNELQLPINPMIGTIGVAPASGRVPTLTPGLYGGNMDIREIGPGARLYLPVFTPLAGFGLGDCKAIVGDGEIAAAGVEVSVAVLAQLRLIRDFVLPSPMVHTNDRWISVGNGPTLEEASRFACQAMIDAMVMALGMDWTDAYMLAGLVGSLRISQAANPLLTVTLHMPAEIFPVDWPAER